jgi:hypothetical protein
MDSLPEIVQAFLRCTGKFFQLCGLKYAFKPGLSTSDDDKIK